MSNHRHPLEDPTYNDEEPVSKIRVNTRDPDVQQLASLVHAHHSGRLTEAELIDRAVELMMREVSDSMFAQERADLARALRYACKTSPQLRHWLELGDLPVDPL